MLLREAPEHAAVTLVGLCHDLLELAGAPVIADRRQDDHLAVGRDLDRGVGVDPDAIEELLVEDERQTVSRQPFTDPAVRPCTMYFWKTRTSRTAGSAPRKPEAAITE